MSFSSTIYDSLKRIETRLGNPILTWQGEEYYCIPSGNGDVLTVELGGFSGDKTVTFKLRLDQFSDVFPKSQQKLTYNEIEYRIDMVRKDLTNTFTILTCVDTTRGI